MASLKDTDEERAHAVQLLGKNLVLWRDGQGKWACFDDRCPHRAAPLSEGRVEKDGSLLCAYHAWRFDADGKCLKIPQSNRNGRDEAQPAACAVSYPTKVAQEMIWVWGEAGPDAVLESALAPLPLDVPELDDTEARKDGRVFAFPPSQIDMPYGWDTVMENHMDPSHVPVSHHGEMLLPAWMFFSAVGVMTRNGFALDIGSGGNEGDTALFKPPALVTIWGETPDGAKTQLILYATPTRPGWTRLIARQVSFSPSVLAPNPAFLRSVVSPPFKLLRVFPPPAWLVHLLTVAFTDQDMVFLHDQGNTLASAGVDSSNYGKLTFTPCGADRGVLALRRWITTFGSGGPAWDASCDKTLPPRVTNRNELFNVYERHTKNCKSCQGALKNVNKSLTTARVASIASIAWAVLRGARSAGSSASPSVLNFATTRAMLPGLAVAAVSLGVVKALEKLRGMFYTHSFSHQDNP
ncbi:unnamed protein product [Sphacelaria rigidula]